MSSGSKNKQFIEEIELFIQYAVPKQQVKQALALIEKYRSNSLALRLLREYYSALPESREEPVTRIARLVTRQGVGLFVVSTTSFSYLYVLSTDHVLLLGEYIIEVDEQLLSFFDFQSQEEFLKICLPPGDLEEYADLEDTGQMICPACGVGEGEFHLLGCTVEVCPWCEGNLSKCNCRFEQLETDEIEDEEELEEFVDRLTAKGRIAHKRNQAPAYPGTGGGLDEEKNVD
jgi:hypothetical protein